MKNLILALLSFFFVQITNAQTFSTYEGALENKQVYRPVSKKNFTPISSQEDTVRFTGVFHGQVVGGIKFTWLEDELVVLNKNIKKLTRIYSCGNKGDFYPWKEKRKKKDAVVPLQFITIYVKGEKGEKGDSGYTPRKNIDYFDGENGKDFIPPPSNWGWKSTVSTLSGGIVGGAIGGYVFPDQNITTKFNPGVGVRTADGTYFYGPSETTVRYDKKFSLKNAAIGLGSGLILGYILNSIF